MSPRECSEDGCARPVKAKGLCGMHYQRARRPEDTPGVGKYPRPVRYCAVEGCERRARGLGLCPTHYSRQRNNGTTEKLQVKLPSLVRNEAGEKQCSRCDHWLPTDQFNRNNQLADGLNSYCGWCSSLAKFGLDRNSYSRILEFQGGVCAICRGGQWGNSSKFAVDHDHTCCPGVKSCGKCVRGLLCNGCNSALGMVKDNIGTLRAAIAYLEGPR